MTRPTAVLLALLTTAGAAGVVGCRTPQAESNVEYFCAMHPQIVQDHPGNCPICQMRLEKRVGHGGHEPAPQTVPGRAAVVLSPEKRQMLGVRSEPALARVLDGTFRTVGRVTVDETRVHHIHAKFEGYVEHLFVDFTGRFIQKGEPLLDIYSPELVATQQEYLLARRAHERLKESRLPSIAEDSDALLESARRRLLLWDIAPADIARIDAAGQPLRALPLHAPMAGYVLEKSVLHGMRVTPMDSLFRIADLSRVWVLADVYEQDLARVAVGARAEIKASHAPERAWSGRVAFIAPVLDEATRTIKVRIEVANADAALKPEMFADVSLHYGGATALAVPESAVIDSGERHIVFVDREDGTLEPREVVLGLKTGAFFPVASGLTEGERVVVSANFLVDSESSLKAALAASRARGTEAPAPPAGHSGH